MGEEVKLYTFWGSPFALRIVWALKLKGVDFEMIEEDLPNKSKELVEYNPVHKKVPVLVHNGKAIAESLLILEYIDETWKQNYTLLPQHPHQRALARFWAKFGDDHVLPTMWGGFKKQGKEQEEAYSIAIEKLKCLEEQLKGNKLFFGGDRIGYTDIALGWLANLVSVIEKITQVKLIDEEKLPLLSAWTKAFADFPVIKDNWPPRDKLKTRFHTLRESALAQASK